MYAMTRSKKMKPVKQLAETREKNAVQVFGRSQQLLTEQQARLEELRVYRDQYTRSFQTASGAGLGAGRLQDYRVFLGRLNEAIAQQEVLIQQLEVQHEQTREQWIATRSHSQAIDKVVEQYRKREQQQQDRREQQESDEHAQRKSPESIIE